MEKYRSRKPRNSERGFAAAGGIGPAPQICRVARRALAHLALRGMPILVPARPGGGIGYGHSARLHMSKILQLSEDLPLVIEIIDGEDKINTFLPELDRLMTSGLITIESVRVLQYGSMVAKPASDHRRDGRMSTIGHRNPAVAEG